MSVTEREANSPPPGQASTHTEVYRTFDGALKKRPAVERILGWSGVRIAFRRKLPALILFTPCIIAALVGCVSVHLSFTVEEFTREMSMTTLGDVSPMQALLGSVAENIFRFLQVAQFFAMLTLAWYGSHLIAEDKRMSANLLYFARPVTPLRYILGKLLTAFFLGVLTLMLPALMICWQAAFSSPDWAFLKEKSRVIWTVVWYSAIWIVVMSSVIVAISSCFSRKGLAVICTFAVVFVFDGVAQVISKVTGNQDYGLLSLNKNLQALADWLFHESNLMTNMLNTVRGAESITAWNVEGSFWALGLYTFVSWVILWRNVRRMEVIA